MGRSQKPQLITDARRSPEEELRSREVRYVLMMGLRALCVVAGAVLVMTRPPLLGLWLVLCVAGAVVLPWVAVLLANDSAPRPEHQLRNRMRRQSAPHPQPERALTETLQPEHKVIDAEQ